MPKLYTPAMERYNRKYKKKNEHGISLTKAAVRRFMRNKTAVVGCIVIIFLFLVGLFAPLIAPYEYQEQNYSAINQPPSKEHLFGTDALGRDIFSRCVWGARVSLPLGFLCVISSVMLGGVLGIIAGVFGGKVDNIIMRFMDIFQAIPGLMMTVAIVASLGNGIPQLLVAISVSSMPHMCRNFRAAMFTVKDNEYVESSKAIGLSYPKIIVKHLIPNVVGIITINLVARIGGVIMQIASLSYLGLGIKPPTPEWGSLLSAGREYLRSGPHMVIFPGLMIACTVVSLNLFAQGLRDALDPKLK